MGFREHALAGAACLSDVLAEHAGDPEAQALAFEARLGAELADRYDLSAARDRAFQRAYRGETRWEELTQGHGRIETTMTARAGDDPNFLCCHARCSLTQSLRSRLTQRCSIGRRGSRPTLITRRCRPASWRARRSWS